MPIDYSRYPPDWFSRIRPAVLKRAKNCCEFCGVKNYAIIDRGGKVGKIKIVLTIAHLDHDPENWKVSLKRLRALCQKCHIRYDRAKHKDQMSFVELKDGSDETNDNN